MKIGIVIALLAALAGPASAQDQPANPGRSGDQDRPGTVERVETPQGTVTVIRPAPLAEPTVRPQVNFDPTPPPPQTPFLSNQLGNECWHRPCSDR